MSPGVGPRGKMGWRVIVEPHYIPVEDEGDADDRVGVFTLELVHGMCEPEGKVSEDAKLELGGESGLLAGGPEGGEGWGEVGDGGGLRGAERGVRGRGQLDKITAAAQRAGPRGR